MIGLQQKERNMIAPLVEKGSAPKLELLQLDLGAQRHAEEWQREQTERMRARVAQDRPLIERYDAIRKAAGVTVPLRRRDR